MPKLVTIKPHFESDGWRVIIPRDLAGPKGKKKLFKTKFEAETFAASLMRQRQGGLSSSFLGLDQMAQSKVLQALESAGSPDEAVAFWKSQRTDLRPLQFLICTSLHL